MDPRDCICAGWTSLMVVRFPVRTLRVAHSSRATANGSDFLQLTALKKYRWTAEPLQRWQMSCLVPKGQVGAPTDTSITTVIGRKVCRGFHRMAGRLKPLPHPTQNGMSKAIAGLRSCQTEKICCSAS